MRLTLKMKEQIINNVVHSTLNRRRKKLHADQDAFGDAVYKHLFGEHAKLLITAPNGFFAKQNGIKVKFGDRITSVTFSELKPIPHAATGFRTYHQYPHGHSLSQRFIRLDRRNQKISKDKRELENTVRATLSKITTDKKLLEIWPEAEKYLPKKTTSENLPAVPVANLNTMIADLSAAD